MLQPKLTCLSALLSLLALTAVAETAFLASQDFEALATAFLQGSRVAGKPASTSLEQIKHKHCIRCCLYSEVKMQLLFFLFVHSIK